MKHFDLTIMPSGYGHWRISTHYYGKEISCITNDSLSVDDFNSEDGDRDARDGRTIRKYRGYKNLRDEIISKHKN